MKCDVCKNEIENDELNAILISTDGDFACSQNCVETYEKEKEQFFNEIVHDESKFINYLKGN